MRSPSSQKCRLDPRARLDLSIISTLSGQRGCETRFLDMASLAPRGFNPPEQRAAQRALPNRRRPPRRLMRSRRPPMPTHATTQSPNARASVIRVVPLRFLKRYYCFREVVPIGAIPDQKISGREGSSSRFFGRRYRYCRQAPRARWLVPQSLSRLLSRSQHTEENGSHGSLRIGVRFYRTAIRRHIPWGR